MMRCKSGLRFRPESLLANIWHQCHEASTLDGVFDSALEGGAVAATFAAEQFALAGAHFLQALHVFVIDKSRTRASLFSAKAATIFAATTELLANHRKKTSQVDVQRASSGESSIYCGRRKSSTAYCDPVLVPLEYWHLFFSNHE
jgi:hypothetical protein